MYARLLFVVVGILGPLLARLTAFPKFCPKFCPTSCPLVFWARALASPEAADIRWRHE